MFIMSVIGVLRGGGIRRNGDRYRFRRGKKVSEVLEMLRHTPAVRFVVMIVPLLRRTRCGSFPFRRGRMRMIWTVIASVALRVSWLSFSR